jgi:hypothetical protein
MATPYYRALATASFLRDELNREREARRAMELCFQKIHKSLDLYKGHFINRLRFHLNRHHAVYVRKVRVSGAKDHHNPGAKDHTPVSNQRRSLRVAIASDLAVEVENLKKALAEKETEIQRLCMLLDEK